MDKFYKKKSLSKGETVELPDIKIEKVYINEQLVRASMNGVTLWFGFNWPPLGFGIAGTEGYMYPEHLPYGHTGFVMSRNSFNVVQHRSSNEKMQLKFDRNFVINGEYVLIKPTGETEYYTSALWNKHPKEMRAHAESLQGKTFKKIKGTVYNILNSDTGGTHNALLISKISTEKKDYCVFLLFDEAVIYGFPLNKIVEI